MHPEFRREMIHEQERRLEEAAARSSRLAQRAERPQVADEVVALRLCNVHDDATLEQLALLEGRPAPQGRFVVAEIGGEVVAALPLRGGAPLADPFRPTAHLLPLLRLRASQLEAQPLRIRAAKAIAARVLHPAP
jgi:hypothetical protein